MKNFKNPLQTIINWSFWSLLFLLFSWWHGAFEHPLSAEEKQHYSEKLAELNPDESPSEFLKLLERDRGEPIFILNAIKYYDEPVITKDHSKPMGSKEVAQKYNNYVTSFLIKRGSYPIFFGDALGVTAAKWGVDYEGDWSTAAVVRYRSMRTLLDLAIDPTFREKHHYKKSALERTIAYPNEARLIAGGLNLVVFLILLCGALISQLIINRRKK
ncbi:hypothetical protein ACJJIW_22050 [Microbulbifer sp. JMSA004]|uniref:hypothetical protein n=1 Tax=Microbulbifer sp. JMSA004 TaxID=3243370 RepID=UPI0040394FAF